MALFDKTPPGFAPKVPLGPKSALRGSVMISVDKMRKEILRLVKARHNSAFIDIQRISVLYNVPERKVREELTKLADEKVIRLAGWDGKGTRAYSSMGNADEFVACTQNSHLHVDLVEPENNERARSASA
jgi:hypothetical protein